MTQGCVLQLCVMPTAHEFHPVRPPWPARSDPACGPSVRDPQLNPHIESSGRCDRHGSLEGELLNLQHNAIAVVEEVLVEVDPLSGSLISFVFQAASCAQCRYFLMSSGPLQTYARTL